jgi:citrate lyase subunit beta/citryl-CoA lyase
MGFDLFAVRSLLFLPASNPRAIAKARDSAADLVILDLEDAVKAADKVSARAAAAEAVRGGWPMPVAIRINAGGTAWHSEDLKAVAESRPDALVVPKVETGEDIVAARQASDDAIIAMIETPRGVLQAGEIASTRDSRLVGLLAGTNDLRAELHVPSDASRAGIAMALQAIVVAARAGGVAVFDGVFNRLEDADGFAAECREARALGFDGKCLIHPNQIETCNRIFSPSDEDVDRARRLIDAASGGAERFDGEMVEDLHVAAARRLLERSRHPAAGRDLMGG